MKRLFTVCTLILSTFIFDKCFSKDLLIPVVTNYFTREIAEICFLIFGILIIGLYTIYTGLKYSHIEHEIDLDHEIPKDTTVLNNFQKYLIQLISPLQNTFIGRYFNTIYAPPIKSEQFLGKFFFGKTILTTAIAFYNINEYSLFLILAFSASFDFLTGYYQQTLMNFFHYSLFKNKFFIFIQNLLKRYFIDIIRAEVIFFILLGHEFLTFSEQFHIFRNRFVNASYYFNAVIIDRLVEEHVISRNTRSKVVIFASTFGGLLCLLDFAKTSFPSWISKEMIASIPGWIPSPLMMLVIFNLSIFIIFGTMLLSHRLNLTEKLKLYRIKNLPLSLIAYISQIK